MKDFLSSIKKNILPLFLAVLLIIALVQIAELEEQVGSLSGTVSVQMDNMRHEISNISYSVDRSLGEANSLLAGSEYSLTGFDLDDRTVQMTCTVSPKEYQPGITAAYLLYSGKEYKMWEENGVYTAELTLPLFEETTVDTVRFEENGIARTESLDWTVNPREEYIPYVSVQPSAGMVTGPQKDQNGRITAPRTYDWEVSIRLDRNDDSVGVQSITLIEFMNGEEIERTDIPLNTVRESDDPNVAPVAPVGKAAENPSQFFYSLEKTVDITEECVYEMYVEVVDSYGLHHRVQIDRYADGEEWDAVYGDGADIYDADGNLLYDAY